MAFVANGIMFGSWASRIPAIKEQAGLDSAQLGFALLGVSIGAVLAMTFAGYFAGRVGSHVVTWLTLLGCAVMLPVIASSASFLALAGSLLLFGAAQGSMDVCMNANGLAVERAGTKPIMSRLHASWSIGSFLGAVSTTIALRAGLSVFEQFTVLAVVMALASAVLSRTMLSDKHPAEGPAFRRPPRRLAVLGFLAFCGLIAEGSATDWSGVFVKDSLGGSAQEAAIAITVFSAAMAAARLAGDRLTEIWGPAGLVSWGSALAALGLGAALLVAQPLPSIVGFGFMGLGLAAIVPILFRAGGSQPGIASGVGIAAVSTMGYAGGLAGPPVIGSVAGATGLRIALAIPLALLVFLALIAPRAIGGPLKAGMPVPPGEPAMGEKG